MAEELPDFVEPVALQAPGREERRVEPRVHVFSKLVEAALRAIRTAGGLKPSVFLGYSASGIWAFETARALSARGLEGPLMLGVCASPSPGEAAGHARAIARPDRAVRAVLQEHALTPDLRELAAQAILRDITPVLSYRYRPGIKVACPLSLFAGAEDAVIPRDLMRRWGEYTASHVIGDRTYPGGHMFLRGHWKTVAQDFASDVEAVLPHPSGEPLAPTP
ncbi:pyochelin biosynthetic protein PchC [Streptomyces turgidiscabies]|uniref:Pyochelin biosynthetic protein PchC n=2 Tax=Streptomyces turgidiscabies TaxID=85558 RepID=A0ABU0RX29_9ACTN|nr:pyochelin biosynthetic protein PchC [Streptomyces turgidiscabies]